MKALETASAPAGRIQASGLGDPAAHAIQTYPRIPHVLGSPKQARCRRLGLSLQGICSTKAASPPEATGPPAQEAVPAAATLCGK